MALYHPSSTSVSWTRKNGPMGQWQAASMGLYPKNGQKDLEARTGLLVVQNDEQFLTASEMVLS